MRWTKVRKAVHESFAGAVRGRVKINATNADPRGIAYRHGCSEGWISLDDRVVAHVQPHGLRSLTLSLQETSEGGRAHESLLMVEPHPGQKIPAGAQVGTFMDLPQACWRYLHSSINDSLRSPDPFVSALAVLNARVGRTRLQRVMAWDLHPLTRAMLDFRLKAEQGVLASSLTR